MTNVPAPTFGPNGFIAPDESVVLAGVQADINLAFGGNLNPALSTPQGQLASSEAAIIGESNNQFVALTNQFDPAYATGRYQDGLARIYFLERNPALPTSLQIACVGGLNVPIPVGALIWDEDGNIYSCLQAGMIPAGGSVTLSFAAVIPGPTPVPEANGVTIYKAIPGWDSVSVVSGVEGVNTESRAAFEQRREDSVAGNSFGAIGSIIGAVSKVNGVLDYWGYDNASDAPVTVSGVTVGDNSIIISVSGGAPSDIAQAILSKKGGGCGYTGNTTVVAYDKNPLYSAPIPYSVTFEIPTALQILFSVTIVNGPLVPANAVTLVQNALLAAFAGSDGGPRARIASTLYSLRYVSPVAALGSWAQVSALQIGSNNTPGAVVIGWISGSVLTVDTVTSGALVVGQTLSDASGLISVGTNITSFGTGSGGTGTYNLSNSQTAAGATFTGNGSGTNLTVSGITGVLGIGQTVFGAGIPSNTTIISQTSGTPGGDGVYVTSGATTASSATCHASEAITLAGANQNSVVVNGNQEPELNAANIAVALA